MDLHSTNKGCFPKGHIPHNKGKKLEEYVSPEKIEKLKKTQFKPGQKAGSKNNTWKGGVQSPKNDCTYLYQGINKRKRRPRIIWEEHYGKIPDGYVIYHIDGNRYNDDISNLECISRKELVKRNKNGKN